MHFPNLGVAVFRKNLSVAASKAINIHSLFSFTFILLVVFTNRIFEHFLSIILSLHSVVSFHVYIYDASMLQIRVFKTNVHFFIRWLQRWSWTEGLDPQWESKDKVWDNFPVSKISKFDSRLIKMLFCSVAYFVLLQLLVLKMKIWSRCIDCLVKTY